MGFFDAARAKTELAGGWWWLVFFSGYVYVTDVRTYDDTARDGWMNASRGKRGGRGRKEGKRKGMKKYMEREARSSDSYEWKIGVESHTISS